MIEIDISSRKSHVRTRQVKFTPSIFQMYQAPAASEGLHGDVRNFAVTSRLWLAISRKTTFVRTDETVIG